MFVKASKNAKFFDNSSSTELIKKVESKNKEKRSKFHFIIMEVCLFESSIL